MTKKYNKIVDDAIKNLEAIAKKNRIGQMAESGSPLDIMMLSMYGKGNDYIMAGVNTGPSSGDPGYIGIYVLQIGRQALDYYIREEAEPLRKRFEHFEELVKVLDGSSSAKGLERRAVRFENLKSLTGMTSTPMKVKKAQSAPTKEEFNELVDAVRELWGRIFEIEIQRRSHGSSKG